MGAGEISDPSGIEVFVPVKGRVACNSVGKKAIATSTGKLLYHLLSPIIVTNPPLRRESLRRPRGHVQLQPACLCR
jgi:hypothetical protein